ncbi:MAG: cysteine desulfurase family protein [Methylococcales bacterium]|jgi:cysteine desulfurase
MIYFDYNATTPIDADVLEAMLPFLKVFYGNPSSLSRPGRIVHSAINTAREQVAALVDVAPSQVIFTSGGTEANNMALASLPLQAKLAISGIEHPSISEPALRLKDSGTPLDLISVDQSGVITPLALNEAIKNKPNMVSIMLANNETGVIQDIASLTQTLKENNITVHTDAVQALGKIPVSFRQLGVDLMSLSSHKIYGPKGCGALIFDKNTPIRPILLGGGQEQNLRAGTENVAAIVGFGKAAELAKNELSKRHDHLASLKKILEAGLMSIPDLTIFARHAMRLPNTTQFGILGIDGEMLLMKLDKKGFAVSSGSACASGSESFSPVLRAMKIEETLAKSAIRISLGIHNTKQEIIEFIDQLKILVNQL